jgi:hypothetical protein
LYFTVASVKHKPTNTSPICRSSRPNWLSGEHASCLSGIPLRPLTFFSPFLRGLIFYGIFRVYRNAFIMSLGFPEIQGGGSLILAWQIKGKEVLVVGGGEVGPSHFREIAEIKRNSRFA